MARLTMTAAVCDTGGEGDVLSLRQILVDDPHEMEVRVKLLTTSICRSDSADSASGAETTSWRIASAIRSSPVSRQNAT